LVKDLHFVGASLADLRRFPAEARREAGFQLDAVQRGLDPTDWKPLSTVGAGVREIRIHVLGALQVAAMKKTMKVRGSVFLELGFPPEEAAVLKMRADLMGDLREFIRDSKLTQAAVARRLGISQSRVSDLVRGKWEKFNLEMLITLAARAGHKVDLRVVA
jgi:predicted XRE-type DNA-binding protein